MDYPLRLAAQLQAHLRALRKERGLTQAELGQRLGIGQVRVAEIEAKPGSVRVEQLIQLLSVLGATLVLRDTAAAAKKAPAGAKASAAKQTAKTRPLVIPPKKGSW